MQTRTQTPNFTITLRGYDREEVDRYLDSLGSSLDDNEDLQERNHRLQAQTQRLSARVKELEELLQAEPPKSGAALGQRIGMLLHQAEEAAAEAIAGAETRARQIQAEAQARADALIAEADAKLASAEATLHQAVAKAEEQAERIEAAARTHAEEILAEAEARASARARQIEQWAEQVVSHTRAEEARMFREIQQRKEAAESELLSLSEERSRAMQTLRSLHRSIGETLGLPTTANGTRQEPTAAEESAQSKEFETKLEAWVSAAASPSAEAEPGGRS